MKSLSMIEYPSLASLKVKYPFCLNKKTNMQIIYEIPYVFIYNSCNCKVILI